VEDEEDERKKKDTGRAHEVELLSPAELQLLSLYSQPSQGKHLQGKAL